MWKLLLASTAGYGVWKWFQKHPKGPAYVPAKSGDVMSAIVLRFNVPVEAIVAANAPGFARFYAPDGSPVAFKLPSQAKDSGPRDGAQGRYVP